MYNIVLVSGIQQNNSVIYICVYIYIYIYILFLAWRIPGSGEPGGLPSMGSHRVGHD